MFSEEMRFFFSYITAVLQTGNIYTTINVYTASYNSIAGTQIPRGK